MTSLVLHIPHASQMIPSDVRDEILLDDPSLARELLRMTDHFTDELFDPAAIGTPVVLYPVSRLVVDPERFSDDALESMAKRGMGAIYMRRSDGGVLRKVMPPETRRSLMERFYWPHHRALTEAAELALARHDRCLVLDCHSFPARPLPYEIDQHRDRPEICLGTDAFHTPQSLTDAALRAFQEAGFEVALNRPFAGALVPSKQHQKDARVNTLMVEVRRDLYMEEASGARNSAFGRIRTLLQEIVERIQRESRGG